MIHRIWWVTFLFIHCSSFNFYTCRRPLRVTCGHLLQGKAVKCAKSSWHSIWKDSDQLHLDVKAHGEVAHVIHMTFPSAEYRQNILFSDEVASFTKCQHKPGTVELACAKTCSRNIILTSRLHFTFFLTYEVIIRYGNVNHGINTHYYKNLLS